MEINSLRVSCLADSHWVFQLVILLAWICRQNGPFRLIQMRLNQTYAVVCVSACPSLSLRNSMVTWRRLSTNCWLFRAVRSCILFRRSCSILLILLISVRMWSSVVSIGSWSSTRRRRSLGRWRNSMVWIPCIGSGTPVRISACPWIIPLNVLVSVCSLRWRYNCANLARCLFNFIYVLF